jgi:hypothetical protein
MSTVFENIFERMRLFQNQADFGKNLGKPLFVYPALAPADSGIGFPVSITV